MWFSVHYQNEWRQSNLRFINERNTWFLLGEFLFYLWNVLYNEMTLKTTLNSLVGWAEHTHRINSALFNLFSSNPTLSLSFTLGSPIVWLAILQTFGFGFYHQARQLRITHERKQHMRICEILFSDAVYVQSFVLVFFFFNEF